MPISVAEYQKAAEEKLSRQAYDYYVGGAGDELTLEWNERAYDRVELRYRVLRDVSRRDLTTTVLGSEIAFPLVIAPTAFHGLAHPEGEVATARAAGTAGTIMTASTMSNRSIEEITAASSGDVWFQLYVYRDRGVSTALIQRAVDAGCTALVLTVDVPGLGVRERDVRNHFALPEGLGLGNFDASLGLAEPLRGSALAEYVASMFDDSLDWAILEWLRSFCDLPILVKGVVHPEDARLAVEHGVAGIVVSNHGGRQLDTAPATLSVLPEIAEVVDGRVELFVDGGVRRGTDAIKALALGASAVAVGRPPLWGLAVDGQAGVEAVLALLRAEIDAAMAMCGATSIDEIDRDVLRVRPWR